MRFYAYKKINIFIAVMFFLLQLSNIVYAETESELLYLSSIDSYDAFKYEDSIKKLLGAIEK